MPRNRAVMGQGALAVGTGPDFDTQVILRPFERPTLVRCPTQTHFSIALKTLADLGSEITAENDPRKADFTTPTLRLRK